MIVKEIIHSGPTLVKLCINFNLHYNFISMLHMRNRHSERSSGFPQVTYLVNQSSRQGRTVGPSSAKTSIIPNPPPWERSVERRVSFHEWLNRFLLKFNICCIWRIQIQIKSITHSKEFIFLLCFQRMNAFSWADSNSGFGKNGFMEFFFSE